ncbi:GNAT family N-acetyltransferase [Bacillus sp. PAMC26568]|nr:GNAT family N-acetyltransferase [Bacillus sp. PAMC26568]
MEIIIRKLKDFSEAPMDLLLEADPFEEKIGKYIKTSDIYIAELNNTAAAVMVLTPISINSMELMNLAVDTGARGKGIAKKLIAYAEKVCAAQKMDTLVVGTGNSSLDQLALYQKCGFRMKEILEDFFIKHYNEPIFENGIQCRDMVRLNLKIKRDS